ncbi:FG-GAP repeat protein [Candidatus Sumerlaeota bacterium]|nr:FG-GAP repeat protein [Candidatus Sumerlaeota bacterium]
MTRWDCTCLRCAALAALAALCAVAPAKPPLHTSLEDVGITVPGAFFPGVEPNSFLGRSISGAGDVNGDGVADLLIGVPRADQIDDADVGEVHLIFGGLQSIGDGGYFNLSLMGGTRSVCFVGSGEDALTGQSVAGAGDVNGDGFDDILIGAPSSNSSTPRPGTAFLIYGHEQWSDGADITLASLTSAEMTRIEGILGGDRCGVSVAGAGDVNGDGLADILVGASSSNAAGRDNAGETYLIWGNVAGLGETINPVGFTGAQGVRIFGAASSDHAGISVAAAGDITGDGIDDIIIGADGANTGGTDSGAAYLIFGARSGIGAPFGFIDLGAIVGTDGVLFSGQSGGDNLGTSVAGAGDINGDGIDDLLLGAPRRDISGQVDIGQAYLIRGVSGGLPGGASFSLATLSGANGSRIEGVAAGDRAGDAVAGLGDFDGDGLSDLLIGAPMSSKTPPDTGDGYVVFGQPNPLGSGGTLRIADLSALTGIFLEGFGLSSRAGSACAPGGDINGDGSPDLLIGAYQEDISGMNAAGQTCLVWGVTQSVTTVSVGSLPSGEAATGWIGALSNPADPWGSVRAAVGFEDGVGPGADASSRQVAFIHREAATGAGLPTNLVPVHWEISTERTGWTAASVTLHLTLDETRGFDETTLQIYRADTSAGPWSAVTTISNGLRNEVTATGLTDLGLFTVGGTPLTSSQIINHLLGITPIPPSRLDSADLSADGVVDIADAVALINLGR